MKTQPPWVCCPLPATPDLLSLHQRDPARYPHLLESVSVPAGTDAAYDILFAFPEATLELATPERLLSDGVPAADADFLAALGAQWRAERVPRPAPGGFLPPFRGGWFVYLGYDFASAIEPRLPYPRHQEGPLALAQRFRSAVVRAQGSGETWLVLEPGLYPERLQQVLCDLDGLAPVPAPPVRPLDIVEEPAARFLEGVRRIQEYVRAGDVFQVNLSRRWSVRTGDETPPAALYARLRQANPAPFAGLATLTNGFSIVSSSPERLVRVDASRVCLRPIAGTIPRSGVADAMERSVLSGHPKERAEHVMLIDLARNDLGRLCRPGTITVPALMTTESYRYVHHLVSEVCGLLAPGTGPEAVLAAVFPGGTITGCPKLRCMEIIREIEEAPRGAYTGSMGYLNRDGDLDLNILIRTLVQQPGGIHLRTGAGIVADSRPRRELEETRAKARGLLAALGA